LAASAGWDEFEPCAKAEGITSDAMENIKAEKPSVVKRTGTAKNLAGKNLW
jgi:hypothetical protein